MERVEVRETPTIANFYQQFMYNVGMTEEIQEKPRTKVLKNGAVYDLDKGRIVGVKPELAVKNTQITSENSSELRRKRQEKQQEALRARILDVTRKHSDLPLADTAEAVAEAGAFLWDEIVLGEDIYPRDRLEAWERIGRHAGILSDKADRDTAPAAEAVTDILREVASIAASLAAAANGFDNSNYRKHDEAIDAQPIDTGQDSGGGERGEDTAADGGG